MNDLSHGRTKKKSAAENGDGNSMTTLDVKILDKDLQVACPADQQAALLKAATLFDKKMRQIQNSGKVIGIERIALIAGLNMAHDFLQAEERAEGKETARLLKKMHRKLDNALQNAQQLEI